MAGSPDMELAADERWTLILRIVSSRQLEKATQLRELLLYLGKKAIVAPGEDLSEQEIGTCVLGRRSGYDPQEDNIVRVQIRRLRQKLDDYFSTAGWDESLIVTIPKGGHVLRFEPRAAKAQPVEPAHVKGPLTPGGPQRWAWVLGAVLAVSAAFLAGRISNDVTADAIDQRSIVSSSPLWQRLFSKDQSTSIVIADSSLVVVQNLLRYNLNLSEYINRAYHQRIQAVQDPAMRDALRMIAERQYTSLADATLSNEFRSIGSKAGARVNIRYARHMHIRDFHSGNFVLLGSSHAVPWGELFEANLNFHMRQIGPDQHFGFRNSRPVGDEAEVYLGSDHTAGPQESFATIAWLPNLGSNGTVLLLTGITMEATEAAGEFALSEDFSSVLRKMIQATPSKKLPYFEILLKASSMAGAPRKVEVVTSRAMGT